MSTRPNPGKERHWLELIRQWRQSQLGIRAFCERYGVSEPNFFVWREPAKGDILYSVCKKTKGEACRPGAWLFAGAPANAGWRALIASR